MRRNQLDVDRLMKAIELIAEAAVTTEFKNATSHYSMSIALPQDEYMFLVGTKILYGVDISDIVTALVREFVYKAGKRIHGKRPVVKIFYEDTAREPRVPFIRRIVSFIRCKEEAICQKRA